jgi:hypothetical protein
MNFLPRLRYILTKTRPQAPTVINILKILCRVAYHSTKVAYDVRRKILHFFLEQSELVGRFKYSSMVQFVACVWHFVTDFGKIIGFHTIQFVTS